MFCSDGVAWRHRRRPVAVDGPLGRLPILPKMGSHPWPLSLRGEGSCRQTVASDGKRVMLRWQLTGLCQLPNLPEYGTCPDGGCRICRDTGRRDASGTECQLPFLPENAMWNANGLFRCEARMRWRRWE